MRRAILKWGAAIGSFGLVAGLIYSLTAGSGSADTITVPVPEGFDSLPAWDRYVDNVAFGVGEKLQFDINYGFINAGSATMEVAALIDYNGRPAFQIVTRAQSNSFFSSFYRVDDRVESIIDAQGLYSWRFEKNLREGKYRADRMYAFDQPGGSVTYEDSLIAMKPFVQDALSSLYFTRTQPLEIGQSFLMPNFVDGKSYDLEVRVIKKERITVSAGTFDCIVVEPLVQTVGVFKHEGKLTVWLTDDRLRMPVLMKSKILVGSVSAELTGFTFGEILEL